MAPMNTGEVEQQSPICQQNPLNGTLGLLVV